MKAFRNGIILAAIITAIAFMFPATVKAAYMERGYFAIGGEWLLPPAVLLIISAAAMEQKREEDRMRNLTKQQAIIREAYRKKYKRYVEIVERGGNLNV